MKIKPIKKKEAILLLTTLSESVERAISSGNWVVDGRNDPTGLMDIIQKKLAAKFVQMIAEEV